MSERSHLGPIGIKIDISPIGRAGTGYYRNVTQWIRYMRNYPEIGR
jgi:hypothetical protein